jgi:pyruvate-formate lyase-activating enzyme
VGEFVLDRWGWKPSSLQFLAHLYSGEHDGKPECYSTASLVTEFTNLQDYHFAHQDHMETLDAFHPTGGTPGLYMEMWPDLLKSLADNTRGPTAFYTNLCLAGPRYQDGVLRQLQHLRRNCMYTVDIKGWSPDEFYRVTRERTFDPALMLSNLNMLVGWGIPLYITYTGMEQDSIDRFEQTAAKHVEGWGDHISRFSIPTHPAAASSVTSSALWGEEFVRGKA